jgi:hypothetical protein
MMIGSADSLATRADSLPACGPMISNGYAGKIHTIDSG